MQITINIHDQLKHLRNYEKIELIEDILGTLNEDGVIEEIRKVVNDPQWDDQKL